MENLTVIVMVLGFGGMFILWELGDLIRAKSALIYSQARMNDAQADLLDKELQEKTPEVMEK